MTNFCRQLSRCPKAKSSNVFLMNEFLLKRQILSATYDLRTGATQDHNAEDYITKQTECDPCSDNGQNSWLDALNTIFVNDQELIDYVQMIVIWLP